MDIERIQQEILADSRAWFGDEIAFSLTDVALGLTGEAGEFADLIKKVMRGTHSLEEHGRDLALELVDVFIYVVKGAALLGIDLEQVYDYKRTYNAERFARKYDEENTRLGEFIPSADVTAPRDGGA